MVCELFPDVMAPSVGATSEVGLGCSDGGDTGLSSFLILLAMMEGRVPTNAAGF